MPDNQESADLCLADALQDGFHRLSGRKTQQIRLPPGTEYRSSGHMRILRDAKASKDIASENAQLARDHNALGQAWNKELGLRVGDLVTAGEDQECRDPNMWSHSGLLRTGWKEVGNKAPHFSSGGATGVNETRRSLDALGSLAAAVLIASEKSLEAWIAKRPNGSVLHVSRIHDPTPLILSFGALEGELQPHARFLVPDADRPGQCKAVPWDAYSKMYPRRQPSKGILDCFAQAAELCAPFQDGLDRYEHVMPPCVLLVGNASTVFDAVGQGCPHITVPKLNALAGRLKWITLAEVPDNCAVNIRKRRYTARLLAPNILFTPHGCTVHLIQRAVSSSTPLVDVVGDVYAVHIAVRHAGHKERLAQALWRIIDRELYVVEAHQGDPRWEEELREIVRHSILRVSDVNGGRLDFIDLDHDEEDETPPENPDFDARGTYVHRRKVARMAMKYLTADPRVERVGHVERGCCRNLQEMKNNCFAALMESGLISGIPSREPSSSRWGSCTESMVEQSGGDMLFRILPRTFAEAFPRWGSIAVDEHRAYDPRHILRKKVYRARMQLGKRTVQLDHSVYSRVMEPVDHLFLRVQHLDTQKSLLMDLQHGDLNPFDLCIRELSRFLESSFDASRLRVVYNYYCRADEEAIHFSELVQDVCLSLIGQLWWRFSLPFCEWPYLLTIVAGARASTEAKQHIFKRLWNAPLCCLDEFFARKVPRSLSSSSVRLVMFRDDAFQSRPLRGTHLAFLIL